MALPPALACTAFLASLASGFNLRPRPSAASAHWRELRFAVHAQATLRGLAAALVLAFAGSAAAQQPATLPNAAAVHIAPAAVSAGALTVSADRADWTYTLGSPATFRVQVQADPYPVAGVPLTYRLGPDMLEGPLQHAIVPREGLLLQAPSPAEPGFVRCIATMQLDGKPVSALATAGFSPERIMPTQSEPADFDAFWRDQKHQLDQIPADYQLTPAPELSTPSVEVSYLSFQNVGNWRGHSRFYGVLAVPRAPGRYPAVLQVPGAGVRPYSGARALAEKGVITLQVGIHGIPVNLAPEVYEQLARGALSEYQRYRLDDRKQYYYRRVYLGVLRANDYLAGLSKWDGKNLAVQGGSQGGQLSIMAAALDRRVTVLAAEYPAYSDVSGYLHGRAGGWPGLFRPEADGRPGDAPVEPKLLTSAYYDTVNFARRLTVPGLYFWGYNDVVTPPTSTYAVYNTIKAPKQLYIAPEYGHQSQPEHLARIESWLLAQFAGTAH